MFIDVGSFERLVPGEPWPGYRQFCELFLNPLYLQAVADVPFQPWLRGSVHGISPTSRRGPSAAAAGSGATCSCTCASTPAPSAYADADADRDVKGELSRPGFGPKLIDAQMTNLRKAVERLEWKASASTWSTYSTEGTTPTPTSRRRKPSWPPPPRPSRAGGPRPGRQRRAVLRVAVDAGASLAIAVDGDHLVVDHLYRHLRSEGEPGSCRS